MEIAELKCLEIEVEITYVVVEIFEILQCKNQQVFKYCIMLIVCGEKLLQLQRLVEIHGKLS